MGFFAQGYREHDLFDVRKRVEHSNQEGEECPGVHFLAASIAQLMAAAKKEADDIVLECWTCGHEMEPEPEDVNRYLQEAAVTLMGQADAFFDLALKHGEALAIQGAVERLQEVECLTAKGRFVIAHVINATRQDVHSLMRRRMRELG